MLGALPLAYEVKLRSASSRKTALTEAVNYTDDMVRDALIRGLGDSDIQQDVLGHNDQDMTPEDTIKFIEAKEAGKRSQATLQNPSAATVSSSKQTDKDQHVVKCRNCGKRGHGDGCDTQARKEKCKAWDKFVQSVTKGTISPTSAGLNPT